MQGFLLEGIKYVADHIEKTPYQLEMMRVSGYFMKTISDSTVQELLREREMDTEGLAKFLLYMDDKRFMRRWLAIARVWGEGIYMKKCSWLGINVIMMHRGTLISH